MKLSQLFTKTEKLPPAEEVSANAQLLERGGFIYKNNSGIYTFLPLGWRVLQNINQIIREEMDAIGGQEMQMPSLINKRYWEASGRWEVDVMYKLQDANKHEYGLGWTHEEVTAEIAKRYLQSYKDMPFSLYQIQTKFRNEARAKSGILRGREFLMKDLYSFHPDEASLNEFYWQVGEAYHKIFKRCGLLAVLPKSIRMSSRFCRNPGRMRFCIVKNVAIHKTPVFPKWPRAASALNVRGKLTLVRQLRSVTSFAWVPVFLKLSI